MLNKATIGLLIAAATLLASNNASALIVAIDEDVMTSGFFQGANTVRGYAGDNRVTHRVSTNNPFGTTAAETIYVTFDFDFVGTFAGPISQALLSVQSVAGGFGADAGPSNPFTVSAHAVDTNPLTAITDDTNPTGPIAWNDFFDNNIIASQPESSTVINGLGTFTFDVTSIVNDWISGANTAFAIALTGKNDTSGLDFLHGFANNTETPGSTFLNVTTTQAIPEPASMSLLGLTIGAGALRRRRQNAA